MKEKNSEKKERKMRDSGIPWIGEVPEWWKVGKIKQFCILKTGKTPNTQNKDMFDGPLNWYTPADFSDTYALSNASRTLSQKAEKSNDVVIIPPNSVMMIGIGGTAGKVGLTCERCSCNQQITAIIANKMFYKYLMYYMVGNVETLKGIASYTTLPILNNQIIGNYPILIPEQEEQHRIADFLDSKCSEIDTLIENLRARMESAKEYKKAVITEAVTKGLNKDAKMQDSGVEWIGDIPEGWTIMSAKYLFSNSDKRKRLNDEQLTSSQKYGIITQKEYMQRENAKIVIATQGIEKWKHVEPNDFIISLRSFQGGLEMSEITGCITWHYVVLKPAKEIIPRYYKWFFKSDVYIKALQNTCNFIRDGQDLRYSNFVQVPLIDMPLNEQCKIADYLDSKCSEIDALLQNYKDQIATLEEYKKSLIYEYVTGKKEVPAA